MAGNIVSMLRKRLLVTISFSFSIRYLYRTGMLQQLRNFADVVVAITWNEEELIRELKADGFEVHLVPESKKGVVYETARKRIDYWFTFFRLNNSKRVQRSQWQWQGLKISSHQHTIKAGREAGDNSFLCPTKTR